ncbi:MAG: TetR/AcrR family transcriptional regulator [bacterium]
MSEAQRALGAGRRVARTPANSARRGRARAAQGRPQRGTAEGTRQRLIAAAAEVLNRDGYFGTDSNALARAAGYSPATFYKHFTDKREILLAAYQGWVATEWHHIGSVLHQATSPAQAKRVAGELTAWVLEHHRRWRGLRASILGLLGADAVVRDFYVARRRDQLELLARLRRSRRSRSGAREADAVLLFTFERTCDAMVGGEAEALGLDVATVEGQLVELLATHLS